MNENPSFPYPPSLPMSRSNVCVRIDIYFFRGLLEYIPHSFHTLISNQGLLLVCSPDYSIIGVEGARSESCSGCYKIRP